MKTSMNRTISVAFSVILIISMFAIFNTLQTTTAHTPAWEIPTYAYIKAAINPIGVGQTAYIYMWLDKTISGALMNQNDIRFHNYKLTITAPNGDITTKTWDIVTDTTSNQGYSFTPDQVGEYTLSFSFPGQTYTWSGAYQGDYYLPSNASTTLIVTEEPTQSTSGGTAMPTEYWTRPIYGENTDWYSIASNWLGSPRATNQGYGSCYPGDAIGSQTSHVMWTKSIQDGGVVGGTQSSPIAGATYFEGTAYNGRFTNPIILAGKLYYTEPMSFIGGTNGDTVCVDLCTGEEYWRRSDVPALSFGLVYDVRNPNQYGTFPPILVGRIGGSFLGPAVPVTWRCFDAYTGDFLFNATNIPTGTSEVGPNGEYLIYSLNNYGTAANPNWYLTRWNSTKLWTWGNSPAIASNVDASTLERYDFNLSVSDKGITANPSEVLIAYNDDFAICRNGAYPSIGGTSTSYTYYAININDEKGTMGNVLWTNQISQATGNKTISYSGADKSAKVFVEQCKETMQYIGYSMETGKQLWITDNTQDALNYYSSGYGAGGNERGAAYAYGKLYITGMSGFLYCYDLSDGKLLWTYGNGGEGNSTFSGMQVPGNYPISTYAIGNGIVYTTVTEHTVNTPIYKGAMTLAINATDGTEIWKLRSVTQGLGGGAIADGYNIFFNGYDNQIYALGKGPSQTTAQAPTLSVTYGNSVFIQGTVTDISSGTTQNEQASRFPNGVPVASDASMTEWMPYIYEQQAKPTNFTGVEVMINVVDANGNYRSIGTATTDSTGYYSLVWTPDIEGKYSVYATFEGTKGYWGSSATTGFNVDPAAATPTPQATQPSLSDQYILPGIISIIAAIAIGFAITIVVLKKKP